MAGFQIFIKDKNLEICDTDELNTYFELHAARKESEGIAKLVAVVLCGGASSRMGEPKFLLQYHELPQYLQVASYMEKLGIPVYFSCKPEQENLFPPNSPLILDKEAYGNAGPMSGLLSAAEELQGKSILLLGCDYPLIQLNHLSMLAKSYFAMGETTCFYNFFEQRPEALLAIYQPEDIQQIKADFSLGKQSLTEFLNERNCLKMIPENAQILQSFNTKADVKDFATLLSASQQKNPVF